MAKVNSCQWQRQDLRKDEKNVKVCLTVVFVVNKDGQKLVELVIIWKTKSLCYFQIMKNHEVSRSSSIHYFYNKKAWKNSEIKPEVLERLLFLDNVVSLQELIKEY